MAELLEQIKQLTPAEQLALIREITLNLECVGEDELSPEQKNNWRNPARRRMLIHVKATTGQQFARG
jgi:16S rRNA C1402 (ribose-2'-O) methylase RsmI